MNHKYRRACGVLNYGSDGRKGVVNQCLKFGTGGQSGPRFTSSCLWRKAAGKRFLVCGKGRRHCHRKGGHSKPRFTSSLLWRKAAGKRGLVCGKGRPHCDRKVCVCWGRGGGGGDTLQAAVYVVLRLEEGCRKARHGLWEKKGSTTTWTSGV